MLIFEHKSKDIAPYLVYTNDDNFILNKDDIGADVPDPSDTVSEEPNNVISTVVQNAVSGSSTQMSTTRIFTLGENDYVYLVGYQNSGGDLTCSAGIELTQLA